MSEKGLTPLVKDSRIGMPKAAVFPVPVWAWAMTSFPFMVRGMVAT